MHSFILFTQEKKKRTKEHIVTGTTMCSFSSLRLYIIWVQKVIFVQCCLTFLFFSLPPPLPPVDGCDIVTVGSHAPFFFSLIVLLYCTYFWLRWWWNIDDGRPTFALKVIFLFPLPTLSPFHPSLFLFSKMYCPLFFTSPIPPPHPPPSAHVFSHLLSPPTSVSFHIYPISLWLPAKQIIS